MSSSKMHGHDEITIPNVTPEKVKLLREYFAANEGHMPDGNEGLAESPCFAAKYTYEPSSSLLTLVPLRLMPNLRPGILKRQIQGVIDPPAQFRLNATTGNSDPEPTPNACASYNWVVGFIDNQSGGTLTYSTNSTDHGTFKNQVSKIPNGNTFNDQADTGVFQNQGTKDSGLGCYGSVTYQLADGVTTLTISYGVNTSSTHSASAGLSGQNAARYTAECTYTHKFSGKNTCEYLYPYVTLTVSS